MNPDLLRKARNLADGFAAADTDDVAVVLGEALLEVLAELLVPEDERVAYECSCGREDSHTQDECNPIGSVAEAKAQHPAYQPPANAPRAGYLKPMEAANEAAFSELRAKLTGHPEFLEGEEAYAAAPVGTHVADDIADSGRAAPVMEKYLDGWFYADGKPYDDGRLPFLKRRVLRWGYGD